MSDPRNMCVCVRERERERRERGERSVTHADASHNCDQHERERGSCARVECNWRSALCESSANAMGPLTCSTNYG